MAHVRQSRPDSGLGFQVKVPKTFQVVPSSLGAIARAGGIELSVAEMRAYTSIAGVGCCRALGNLANNDDNQKAISM